MGDMQDVGVLLRVTADAELADGLHMAESSVYRKNSLPIFPNFHTRTFSPTADLSSVSLGSLNFLLMILSRILPFRESFSVEAGGELKRQTGWA